MRLTIQELREIIKEGLAELPDLEKTEALVQSSQFDQEAISRVLSKIDMQLPTSHKLLLSQLARVIKQWQSGRVGFGDVSKALAAIYAVRKRPSYTILSKRT